MLNYTLCYYVCIEEWLHEDLIRLKRSRYLTVIRRLFRSSRHFPLQCCTGSGRSPRASRDAPATQKRSAERPPFPLAPGPRCQRCHVKKLDRRGCHAKKLIRQKGLPCKESSEFKQREGRGPGGGAPASAPRRGRHQGALLFRRRKRNMIET